MIKGQYAAVMIQSSEYLWEHCLDKDEGGALRRGLSAAFRQLPLEVFELRMSRIESLSWQCVPWVGDGRRAT